MDISSVPAPEMTDATYPVKCLKLSGHDITCQLRSGYNSDQIAGTKYRFICPQVYKAGAGKIVANNITANTLSAISAQLGEVGDGPDYNLTLSEGMTHPRGTFLLGSTTDTAYFRRWFANGVWNMAIKLASFIVDSVSSKVKGMFQVFRTTDNEAAAKPAFQVNPGSAAGSESTEIRGAFRVKKSTALSSDADQTIFEALPNGEINSLGKKISVEVGSARTTVRYTGFIKIKIPHKIDGNMLSFIVNIYGNYSSSIINITGYLYRAIGDWYSPKAELVSGISRKVDFGIDTDGFVFVAISGNIEYVTVSVTNYIESYDSIGFKDKWEVSFVDSLSGSISVSYQNIYGRNIYSELSTTDINVQRDATIQRDLSVNGGLLTKNNALFQGNVQVNGTFQAENAQVSNILTAQNANITGDLMAAGSVIPSKGIFNSWYWGLMIEQTQNQWFEIFKDRIPIGKRLNVFGGARIKSFQNGNWYVCVLCFLERINDNLIEINGYPISSSTGDYLARANCNRGNNSVVSSSHYFGW